MRWLYFGMILGLVTLMACTSTRTASERYPVPPGEKACASWRLVGVSKSGTCPTPVEGWVLTKQIVLPSAGAFTDSGLDKYTFCTYERQPSSTAVWNADKLAEFKGGKLDPDCAAVVPAGDDLFKLTAGTFHRQFLQEAGRATSLAKGVPVRLSFIDTQPTASGAPQPLYLSRPQYGYGSLHGYTLANIGRELLSLAPPGGGSQDTAAQITTRLALKVVKFDPTSPRDTIVSEAGGTIGTLSDLADAIQDEVAAWETSAPEETRPHLILNLSVGWDGDIFGGNQQDTNDFPVPVQKVYSALRYAASKDVLVIAAAGNNRYCPLQGPLLPAGWEGRPQEEGAKLVYAVGGIQADGYPIANARANSMPPRAAYADHAVVQDLKGNDLPPMTGTSVAAAVVSSAAAVLWSQKTPSYSNRASLMAALEARSDPLQQMQSDFPLPAQTVRKIKVCSVANCVKPESYSAEMRSQTAKFVAQVTYDVSSLPLPGGRYPRPSCPEAEMAWNDGEHCVHPQPQSDPCYPCNFSSAAAPPATLQIAIPSSWPAVTATEFKIYCSGSQVYHQTLNITLSNGTTSAAITGINAPSPSSCAGSLAATLEWVDAGGGNPYNSGVKIIP